MQTTQQQLYFGSMNLDRNRDRRMVFYVEFPHSTNSRRTRSATRCNGTMTN